MISFLDLGVRADAILSENSDERGSCDRGVPKKRAQQAACVDKGNNRCNKKLAWAKATAVLWAPVPKLPEALLEVLELTPQHSPRAHVQLN